jgi:hypothetical protein
MNIKLFAFTFAFVLLFAGNNFAQTASPTASPTPCGKGDY